MNKQNIVIAAVLVLLLVVSAHFPVSQPLAASPANSVDQKTSIVFPQGETINKSPVDYASTSLYSDLPVGNVESYKSNDPTNSNLTAIFIPQVHRSPGDPLSSSTNDSAVVAQDQIYQIIKALNQNLGVDFVVVEGELYGKVSDAKLNNLHNDVETKSEFDSSIQQLSASIVKDPVLSGTATQLNKGKNDVIAQVDRNLLLEGAPYKARAEGENLTLWGAENPDTYKKSAQLAVQYIYLTDRQNQLKQGLSMNQPLMAQTPAISQNSFLLQLINNLKNPITGLRNVLSALNTSAKNKNNNEVSSLAENSLKLLGQVNSLLNTSSSQNTLSRSDNPYASITDPKKISDMISSTEQEMQVTIINQRNKETAENFVKALKENNKTVGILPFGAGHSDGLIQELKNQGINVVVVVPQEVAALNAQAKPII